MAHAPGLNKDVWGGLLMTCIGIWVAVHSISYSVGTLTHMGPGYFPLILGAVLALTGIAIGIKGLKARPDERRMRPRPEWSAWILICAGLIAFVVFAEYAGLVAATFATVFISALGDRDNSWRSATALALAMVVVGVVVFGWALNVQLPLFKWGGA
ncbi:tripartite tricarboxylate transporter TctB [Burkholderia cepacia]|nr:tripartite tricarboxylate transporter TctB [Burkholderia cepacia]RQS40883.1 tripartite tricarboxylate transporter TctB family protein [Burkholderia sp. Bp8990]KVA61487.1 tripartite tricarboxylate transporter TctB [Burkholderia cepacia]KVA64974.1 tripartite tricarboxylate transporter TctB [Burkholderia cepacia]KVA87232.1 tripartite tricarboxylate transporter TctB [Burkholderia cepacia]